MEALPVGFTTSIPVEILLAAGRRPVDLNNVFITDPQAASWVETAEVRGFPRNTCGWIKGIYTAVRSSGIREIVAVTQGDCSNTHALMEVLEEEGVRVFPFAYPYGRDRDLLRLQIRKMAAHFGTDTAAAEAVRERLGPVRDKLRRIDLETWQGGRVRGVENHYYLVRSSDFGGDPDAFEDELDRFLAEVGVREPLPRGPRVAFIGVPPIVQGLYEAVEEAGGRVVFNEVQRQFSMPGGAADLVEQYLAYTYPYSVTHRIRDIQEQVRLRGVDGIIHYVQAFCFRQIEDLLFRRRLDLPVLTLEGDKPGPLDRRSRIRVQAFVEMLQGRASRAAAEAGT